MSESIVAKKGSYMVDVEEGKTYFWCACGRSQKQPFCDGAHKIDGKFKSLKYVAVENKDMYFCGCKLSHEPPFCDGSHSKL